jgi:hypothetical protein
MDATQFDGAMRRLQALDAHEFCAADGFGTLRQPESIAW